MNPQSVREEIATALDTITGLNVAAYPPGVISTPQALVQPTGTGFDVTYGRGVDRMTLVVWVVAGLAYEESAHVALDGYMAGSGTSSVKAVLEAATHTAFNTLIVKSVDVEDITYNEVDFLCGRFTVEVSGKGTEG